MSKNRSARSSRLAAIAVSVSASYGAFACSHVSPDDGGSGGSAPVAGTSFGGAPIGGSPVAQAGSGVAGKSVAAGGSTAGAPIVAGATFGGGPTAGSSGLAGSSAGGASGGSSGKSSLGGAAGNNSMAGAGSAGKAGAGNTAGSGFGNPMHGGQGSSNDRYHKEAVTRNGVNYFFMANGWGPGFQSQSVSWNGTSFTVNSMQGRQGGGYEPASYPTVFCGTYSDSKSGQCGLPRAINQIGSIRTGWRWKPNGNNGEYNAAYDVWLGTSDAIQGHSSFLMMWLRDPPGQQPAGMREHTAVSVANVSGTWDVWVGTVGGKPCISYVRAEGQDQLELEFDVMDFVRDVATRQISLPGSHILSVAVGFEIWNGPVNDLVSEDFYVDVR